MKHATDRVIALDYFRGICILIVILSHAYPFSLPYAYLTGIGNLWTSAAELFFLVSGLTFGIVRGKRIGTDFKTVVKKSWRRSLDIYLIYVAATLATILMGEFISSAAIRPMVGNPVSGNIAHVLWQVLTFQLAPGLANFLKLYAVYMILAPFVLRAFYSRRLLWVPVLGVSAAMYAATSLHWARAFEQGPYGEFAIWQLYFVIGILLARYRVPLISWIYGMSHRRQIIFRKSVLAIAGVALLWSVTIGYSIFFGAKLIALANNGWLPQKVIAVYNRALDHRYWPDMLFMNNRAGLLRPLAALLFLGAAYFMYQSHKEVLLKRTGRFVNAMGRDTLWIFVAQALVIPLLAAMPLPRDFIANTALTGTLIGSMWLVTQRAAALALLARYQNIAARNTKLIVAQVRLLAAARDQTKD